MIYYLGKYKTSINGIEGTPRLDAMCFKRIHLGIIKIWLGYEFYSLIDPKTKISIIDKTTGKRFCGKRLSQIETKWTWKKR